MSDPDSTDLDPATTAEDERDARADHVADRPPTAEEEAAAERNPLDPAVAEAYEEAIERGANVKGEGQID
jgi:hypothetical protein